MASRKWDNDAIDFYASTAHPGMKLTPGYSVEVDRSQIGRQFGYVARFMPFADGSAVLFCREGDSCWLVEIGKEEQSCRKIPQEIIDRFLALQAGDFNFTPDYPNFFNKIQAFKLGEQIGLLLLDQIVYLFPSIHAEPVMIAIENPFPKWNYRGGPESVVSNYCGNTLDNRVPVLFAHPQYASAISLLEVNAADKRACWRMIRANGEPEIIDRFNYLDAYNREAELKSRLEHPEFDGNGPPMLSDCAWTSRECLLFAIGFTNNYARYGMDFSILTRNDINARELSQVLKMDENCFGKTCASLDKVLLTPLRKNGRRKGKQSFYDLVTATEVPTKLPRGYAGFQIVEAIGQHIWISNHDDVLARGPWHFVRCSAET